MTEMPTTYCDLKTLAMRLGVSTRTVRNWVHAMTPLPAYQPGGKLLFRWTEVEAWLQQNHRVKPASHDELADKIVNSIINELY